MIEAKYFGNDDIYIKYLEELLKLHIKLAEYQEKLNNRNIEAIKDKLIISEILEICTKNEFHDTKLSEIICDYIDKAINKEPINMIESEEK